MKYRCTNSPVILYWEGGGSGGGVPQTEAECVPKERTEEETWNSETELMGDWRKLQNTGLQDLNS